MLGCSGAVTPAVETFMCHAVGWRGEGERSGFPGAHVVVPVRQVKRWHVRARDKLRQSLTKQLINTVKSAR